MGSVEHDELLYDGGSYLMTAEQIDAEYAERRREARERVESRLDDMDEHMLERIDGKCVMAWKRAASYLSSGRRELAMEVWTKAVEDAIEALIEEEL